jgi:hypothetical protein
MRRGFLTVSLVLFVLFDIGLVVLAVRHVQSQTADGAASDASTGTQGDRSSEGPSDDATSRGTPDPAREDDPVMLSVADDGTILRALEGDCAVGPDASVSLSADGGASFEPLALEVAQVLRLSTPAAGVLAVIGAHDDCAVVERRGRQLGDLLGRRRVVPGPGRTPGHPLPTGRRGGRVRRPFPAPDRQHRRSGHLS